MGGREAFFVSLVMAALMILRNSRKTLLDKAEEKPAQENKENNGKEN